MNQPENEGRPGKGASLRVPSLSLQAVVSAQIVAPVPNQINVLPSIGGAS